ncbi:MAG: hypothetical protein AB7G05_12465 [Hyphomonadaceae bacterium]
MRNLVLALAFVVLGSGGASAQQQTQQPAQTPSCGGPEYRQLDFWVGTWDGVYAGGTAVNEITRQFDDCVIQEDFNGGGLIGRSVSMYHAPAGQWRQTWVDNQGGFYTLAGGPVGDDFILHLVRVSDTAPQQRMVFEDITPNAFTWRWQSSTDNGATWTDQWLINYTRRQS